MIFSEINQITYLQIVMIINELNDREIELLGIIRNFNFLHELNYHEKEFSMGGREAPSIAYHNWISNRKIHVIGNEKLPWTILIQRKKIFTFRKNLWIFDISDYYCYFDCILSKHRKYTLKSQAEFIQQYLMPVIKGEVWINELIKIQKK